ncbi:polycomb protein SCMH1-like [Scyliorhinus torazame]|uniref:polycomb protein SCMH1-like n=1 Tax=Scyliorhinus torazame TaxID=75743 RepID=UPI003B5C9961
MAGWVDGWGCSPHGGNSDRGDVGVIKEAVCKAYGGVSEGGYDCDKRVDEGSNCPSKDDSDEDVGQGDRGRGFGKSLAASSTTGPDLHLTERESPRTSSKDPSTWSIEEVMKFVREADPQALAPHADLFRKHEIDGKALLLLRSDMIMKYMGLKLGPALKLCYHIERLKHGKY